MSIKQRLDKLTEHLVRRHSLGKVITKQYAAMSDDELLAEADRLSRDIRPIPDGLTQAEVIKWFGPPYQGMWADVSDEQLLRDHAAYRAKAGR